MAPVPVTNWLSVVIAGFVLGVFTASFIKVLPLISLLIIVVALTVLVVEKVHKGSIDRFILTLAICAICFGIGSLRYAVKDFHLNTLPTPEGVVADEPDHKDNYTQFIFRADNGVKALVKTDLYSSVAYGDRVRLNAEFKVPEASPDFDYRAYLAKDDIYYTANSYKLEVISHNNGNWLTTKLFAIKNSFIERAKAILPEPESSLLMGLIVAGREALPADILGNFRRAGVIHIVVLSGFNITVIAEFLRRVFAQLFLWFRLTRFANGPAIASIIGIGLFVLMTGASATIVRAAVMALTVILARFAGRNYSAPRALIFAGFIMLLANPKILVFDPSFQLSFLATLGMIYAVPPIFRRLHWLTERLSLRETVAQTLGTQLAVLPLLIYSVGGFSAVFLPANVLILPAVPWAMLVGFIATVLAYLSTYLALPFTFVTHLLLTWILGVAGFLGGG